MKFISLDKLSEFLSELKTQLESKFVPLTRTVNGKALSANITLKADDVNAAVVLNKTCTLGTSWSGSSVPYTQAVTVSGILATDTPILDVITTTSGYEAEQTAWNNIFKAITAADKITFYAKEKTTTSITINVKVVR